MVSCRLNQNFQIESRKWIFPIFGRTQNREADGIRYTRKKCIVRSGAFFFHIQRALRAPAFYV
jgi:hypothetical protein